MLIMRPMHHFGDVSRLKMKQKLYQLSKAEVLWKLQTSRKVDISQELRMRHNSPSYKFYQSFDILFHKKIGNTS